MSQEIRLYKLTTGEEIIGRLVSEDEDTVVLGKLRILAVHQAAPGQMGVALIPWMVGIPENDVKIYKKEIVGESNESLPKQLEDNYIQNTSSLALATNVPGQ